MGPYITRGLFSLKVKVTSRKIATLFISGVHNNMEIPDGHGKNLPGAL